MFDRIIFLSEGYTIYNGTPEGVNEYMMQFGLKKLVHCNMADKMSQIASQPKAILNSDVTIKSLSEACNEQQSHNMKMDEDQKKEIVEILSRRFTMIDELRKVSFWRQFKLIYWRNMVSELRNPKQIMALVMMALVQSFILICLY